MRIDDSFLDEEETVFCYHPVNVHQWGERMHSALYYAYHGEHRNEMLKNQALREPELSLALACAGEMGLFGDCAEVCIWRAVCREVPEIMLQKHRMILPELVERIQVREDARGILKELYFSAVMPVVMAMDAQAAELAVKLCLQAVEALEKTYGQS